MSATERRIATARHHISHQKLQAIRAENRQHLLLKEMDKALAQLEERIEAEDGTRIGDFVWEIRVETEYEVEKVSE